ncbi:hypothetical protein GGX14DRAFT_409348 [Mycena pura]|uniref:Uncharacterized protein n=1 Tax=Mycena pura TaxID=153505 RepID=A0AAD6UJ56_9AGAR|nr:hypothetical protein GGX14DRAFT_409348 [Mycena pura]
MSTPTSSPSATHSLTRSETEEPFRAARANITDLLDDLPPPTADDTPRTKMAQLKLYLAMKNGIHVFDRVHEDFKTRRASEALSSGEEGEEGEDQPEEEDDVETRKRRRRKKKGKKNQTDEADAIKRRALEILGAADENLIEPDAYLSLLLNPVKLANKSTEEVRALQVVVRGFEPPTDAWVHLLYLLPTLTDVSVVCVVPRPLTTGPQHLLKSQACHTIETRGIDYLHRLEGIIVQSQYNEKDKNRRQYVKELDKRVFESRYSNQWAGMDEEGKKAKMETMKAERKAVKKDRENLVMARNHLLRAYNLFGTGVILHPMFSLTQLGRHRSKSFNALLDTLWETAKQSPDETDGTRFEKSEPGNKKCLNGILEALANNEEARDSVRNYIEGFYTLYPPFQDP